jgi:hypothetical protein
LIKLYHADAQFSGTNSATKRSGQNSLSEVHGLRGADLQKALKLLVSSRIDNPLAQSRQHHRSDASTSASAPKKKPSI